jgi:phosphoglycerate dehydrogenase-like enzyme
MRVVAPSPLYHFVPGAKEKLLEKYPEAVLWDQLRMLENDELVSFCQGYDAVLISMERFDDYVLSKLPDLRVVAMTSAGVDHMHPDALQKHGVRVGWFPGVNRVAVAEMTISQMIDVLRGLQRLSIQTHNGDWPARRPGTRLEGKTIGIHGCGNIGQEVAKRLAGFNVKLLACDREDKSEFYREYGIEAVGPDELWSRSDVVTIHLPLNSTTRGLYTAEVLDKMKPGAYLINIARGNIVDEKALLDRLEDGRLGGAAFDVFAVEPTRGHPLFGLQNFIGTPHCGSATAEDFLAMAVSGIRAVTENFVPTPGEYPFD